MVSIMLTHKGISGSKNDQGDTIKQIFQETRFLMEYNKMLSEYLKDISVAQSVLRTLCEKEKVK